MATFSAGKTISFYRSVRLSAVALDINGNDTLIIASSDTVGITVSGPASRISVGHDTQKGTNVNDGTFGLPVSAVVTDVNGNFVADGTPVNFSVQPIGFTAYRKGAVAIPSHPYYQVLDSVPMFFPWTDYNNNGKLDHGEEPSHFNRANPYRGEDRDGNGYINEGEWFDDIDGDGQWSTYPEPFRTITITDSAGNPGPGILVFADYNKNGRLDTVETFADANGNGICDCAGTLDSNGILFEKRMFSNSQIRRPFPSEAAIGIKKEISTENGKSVNHITYVQSHGLVVSVRVSAEVNGIRSTDDFLLPVVKSGGN